MLFDGKNALNDIVKRPLLWVMLYAALIGYGVYALVNIHAEVLPQFNMPQVSIVAQLPGATTLDLEGLIAKPIEEYAFSAAALRPCVTTRQGKPSVEEC